MTKRVGALGNCSLLSRVSGTNPIFIKIASRGLCKLFIQRLIFHQQLNKICLIKYWQIRLKKVTSVVRVHCCEMSGFLHRDSVVNASVVKSNILFMENVFLIIDTHRVH